MFTSLALAAAAALCSVASAAPADLGRRDTASCKYATFVPGGYGLDGSPLEYAWTVVIPNDNKYDQTCGQGFSDNFGGQCGMHGYNSFECNLADDGTATITFLAGNDCDSSAITTAIGLASEDKLNTPCTKT